MARYFFNTENGDVHSDHEGIELPSLAAARVEAVRLSGALLQDIAPEFWSTSAWNMTVTDEAGLILFTIDVSGAASPAASVSRP